MAESKKILVTTGGHYGSSPWNKMIHEAELKLTSDYQKPTVKDTLDKWLHHYRSSNTDVPENLNIMGIEDMYPKTMIVNKGEKEMNNNPNIIWRVDSVEIERDPRSRDIIPRTEITAKLVGIPKNIWDHGNYSHVAICRSLQNLLDAKTATPQIKKVIFNNPATIIIWSDGTKTVVKKQKGDRWDPEKGFAMAYLKKLLGGDNTFNKEIKKWVKEEK